MIRRATTGGGSRQGRLRLVLASASPRRLELLTRVGLVPEVVPSAVDEAMRPGESPWAAALRLAEEKAVSVARRLGQGPALVVAADTIVAMEDRIFGKPLDAVEAADMLGRLSGRTHAVHTGFVVLGLPRGDGKPLGGAPARAVAGRASAGPSRADRIGRVVTTRVRVKRLAPSDIAGYVGTGEWRGKAGGYAIQGVGAFMIEEVQGSVTSVVGLPLAEVLDALAALGGPRPFEARSPDGTPGPDGKEAS